MSKEPGFLILKPGLWVNAERFPNLLGTAVQNPASPLQGFVPDYPQTYMTGTVRLDENKYENFILDRNIENFKSGKFSVRNLFSWRASESVRKDLDLRGKLVYFKRLAQHDQFWNRMLKEDEDFCPYVTGWLKEKNVVCLVVGLLLCQDVSAVLSEEQAKEREAKGELPIGTLGQATLAAHGVPLNTDNTGNIEANRSSSRRIGNYFAVEGQGRKIFGLELRVISLQRGDLKLKQKPPDSTFKLGIENQESISLSERELMSEDWDSLLEMVETSNFDDLESEEAA